MDLIKGVALIISEERTRLRVREEVKERKGGGCENQGITARGLCLQRAKVSLEKWRQERRGEREQDGKRDGEC